MGPDWSGLGGDRARLDRMGGGMGPDQTRPDGGGWGWTGPDGWGGSGLDQNGGGGPDQSDIRGAGASHGPCFGMNAHSRRATDVILRLSSSKNRFSIILYRF